MYRFSILSAALIAPMVTLVWSPTLFSQLSLLYFLGEGFPQKQHKKQNFPYSGKVKGLVLRSSARARAPRSTIALLRQDARVAVRPSKQGNRNGSR
jgi:hypothetical protein